MRLWVSMCYWLQSLAWCAGLGVRQDGVPIGSIGAPRFGITLQDPKYQPQEGTIMEPGAYG